MMFVHPLSVFVSIFLVTSSSAKTAQEWRSRSIYQVLVDRFSPTVPTTAFCNNLSTYCGGTWKGLENHLSYIHAMGFDAIWISPVVKNTPNGYHGYWLQDLYKVNLQFGTEKDLIDLTTACHKLGMLVMVDVVANHVGPVGFDYSSIVPFNNSRSYHDYCNIEDWGNQDQVEHCRLSGLPDLNQTDSFVHKTLLNWISSLVKRYDFDGVRIDTVVEVPKSFWKDFAEAASVFQLGEASNKDIGYVAGYQPPLSGLLSFPMYYTLIAVYGFKQSMYELRNTITAYQKLIYDPSTWGTFLDNHDKHRFLNIQSDYNLLKAGLVFTMFSNGIPIVYYGTEQGFSGGSDPHNRECLWTSDFSRSNTLFSFLTNLNKWRKQYRIWNSSQVERYVDDNFFAFTRGTVFVATSNVGSNGGQIVRTITYHSYSVGTKLCNLFYPSDDCILVNDFGFKVYLNNGESKIFVPQSDIS